MMALVAMIVTSLVGALFGFGFGASVLYCGIGLVVFMLLTAYDTQKLRQIYAYYAGDADGREGFHLRRTDPLSGLHQHLPCMSSACWA